MVKVTLIGKGNVSEHLKKAFENTNNVQVLDVLYSRGDLNSKIAKAIDSKTEPDLYIIAVSDDAISPVSQQLKSTKKLVVHTSGSVSINALNYVNKPGVFYPLQSFSKGSKLDYRSIPICLEATSNEAMQLLKKLGEAISNSVYEINSEQRKSLHLAAVFVNNFSNHMYQIGQDICEQNKVSFDVLKPLILETASKINSTSPIDAQTGPARRNDESTIAKQICQLQDKNHQEIYKILTQSIQSTYGKKL